MPCRKARICGLKCAVDRFQRAVFDGGRPLFTSSSSDPSGATASRRCSWTGAGGEIGRRTRFRFLVYAFLPLAATSLPLRGIPQKSSLRQPLRPLFAYLLWSLVVAPSCSSSALVGMPSLGRILGRRLTISPARILHGATVAKLVDALGLGPNGR